LCDRLDLVANGLYPATAIRAGRIRPAPGDTHPRAAAALRSLASATHHDADPLWRDYVELRCRHLKGELAQPALAYEQFALRNDISDNHRRVVSSLAARQPR
jgi:hypothetical protein